MSAQSASQALCSQQNGAQVQIRREGGKSGIMASKCHLVCLVRLVHSVSGSPNKADWRYVQGGLTRDTAALSRATSHDPQQGLMPHEARGNLATTPKIDGSCFFTVFATTSSHAETTTQTTSPPNNPLPQTAKMENDRGEIVDL